MKNTHEGVVILIKLHASVNCKLRHSGFFTFFKIEQMVPNGAKRLISAIYTVRKSDIFANMDKGIIHLEVSRYMIGLSAKKSSYLVISFNCLTCFRRKNVKFAVFEFMKEIFFDECWMRKKEF